jgi:mono/diheme cytochrome c family protein
MDQERTRSSEAGPLLHAASMAPFADAYSDQQIAAVSNYIIGHFGGKQGKVRAADVHASRD